MAERAGSDTGETGEDEQAAPEREADTAAIEEPAEDDRPRPMTPPRPFDAEAEPETPPEPEPSVDEDQDAAPAPEVIDEHASPEASAPFEDLAELPALLEALLFVADHPIEETYLARALEVSGARVNSALEALAATLRDGGRGIRVQRGPEGVQLVSAPEAATRVEHFLGLEANRRLSTAALETLAIVAYRQPITRGQVDAVRGVSSDGAIATLRARGLIAPAGYAAGPGRPMLFQTTQRFLEHFGLERPGQLPPLPDEIDLAPSEIGEQLGLDEQTVAAALAPPPAEEATGGEAAAPDAGDTANDSAGDTTSEEVAGETGDDPGIEIPADLAALSEAAEHALAARSDARPPLASPATDAPNTPDILDTSAGEPEDDASGTPADSSADGEPRP